MKILFLLKIQSGKINICWYFLSNFSIQNDPFKAFCSRARSVCVCEGIFFIVGFMAADWSSPCKTRSHLILLTVMVRASQKQCFEKSHTIFFLSPRSFEFYFFLFSLFFDFSLLVLLFFWYMIVDSKTFRFALWSAHKQCNEFHSSFKILHKRHKKSTLCHSLIHCNAASLVYYNTKTIF